MTDIVLRDPHHVTVGYVGEPGDRTFYVQVEDADQRVTLLVEKGQAAGIGDLLGQLLARLDDQPATDWDRDALALREPIEPRWRVGDVQIGLDPEEGRFLFELSELTPEGEEGDTVRFLVDRDQARRLAAHADEVVGQGRPRCRLCGRPMEADGSHVCPSTNGHGTLTS